MNAPESASCGRFPGKVAVVTGAASGIGAATAQRLAREGAAVIVADVSERGEDLCKLIREDGGRAGFARADVSEEGEWERIVTAAHAFGPVDVLVSNAYALEVKPAHETTRASWDHQLAVSLTASFLGVRALHADLSERRGSIVLVSSVHARFGLPGRPAYASAKGALVSLAGQLAVEYAPLIRVNSVLPGPIITPAWDRVGQADRERSIQATPAGRLGTPSEVAAAVAFLASDEAAFVTGASLVVDGGWSVAKASA